ncbi:MAG TPA: glutaredoxin family protein, partial [Oscillatoriaceae cyanobacterium]
MSRLVLYSGPECSLCDKAQALIARLADELQFDWEVRAIADTPELYARYRERIPVVAIDGRIVLTGKITEFWLRKALRGEDLSRIP